MNKPLSKPPYINPTVDIAFKKIFGVEENKDLLISLINTIVSKEDQIKEVTLLNPYNAQSLREEKLSILDVKATSETGKRYNIEIQMSDEASYEKRALYYWGKLYTEQLKRGQDYEQLNKAIGIHILNFDCIDSDTYHNTFKIYEKEQKFACFEDLELHTIELSKFKIEESQALQAAKVSLEAWITFLKKRDLIDTNISPTLQPIKRALKVLNVMNFDSDENEAYENHLKWLRIQIDTVNKRYKDGRKEEKIAIAKTMLGENFPKETIARITGLSEIEIEKLSSNLS